MTLAIIFAVVFIVGFVLLDKLGKKKPKKIVKRTSKTIKFKGLAFEFLNMINVRRLSLDMGIVRGNDILTKFAKEHCLYMIKKGKASHDNAWKRAEDLKQYGFKNSGEITSKWIGNKRMFEAYLRSQKHRERIEDKRYTDVGIHTQLVGKHLFNVCIFANK